MSKNNMTHQGVRDLNSLGGKRLNGKRPACHHYLEDIVVVGKKEYKDEQGSFFVDILGCARCEEVLGPEVGFEARIKE